MCVFVCPWPAWPVKKRSLWATCVFTLSPHAEFSACHFNHGGRRRYVLTFARFFFNSAGSSYKSSNFIPLAVGSESTPSHERSEFVFVEPQRKILQPTAVRQWERSQVNSLLLE